jgi:MoaA/NifB/PqqE/SkfB family radical SAM enzyme
MEEYGFRFPIDSTSNSTLNSLHDHFGIHLRELLRLLVPLEGGREARIEGYRMLNDLNTTFPLYPEEGEQDSKNYGPLDLYEPRINYIRHLLESLLGIVDLEYHGKTVKVDGFRLKNLKQWLSPGGGATDILAHVASRCNLNCRFCYNRGAPAILRSRSPEQEDECGEIWARIDQYVPEGRLNIFPNMGSPAEALAHPRILEILQELRQKTQETFRIPTNGSTLSLKMITALEKLKPVYLDISLNTSSPERRQWLMGDSEPRIVLDALTHLAESRIPYSVVIVPWPFPSESIMVDDLENTLAFASAHDPTIIQVSFPGYSRALSEERLFPHESVWNLLRTRVQELRARTDCPVVIRPGIFEEYDDPEKLNAPAMVGVIRNSPAHRAGLRRGDRIRKINGLPIKSRTQARSLMTIIHECNLRMVSLSIERRGVLMDCCLHPNEFDYPYTPETVTHLGVVFSSSGIPLDWYDRLKGVVASHNAKRVLLLTSYLVKPTMEGFISRNGFSSGVKLYIRVPENRYFGGNILMGDLLVVQDFIESIKAFTDEEGICADLVVIPSSPFQLSGWGRDLTGRIYKEIERLAGIPVALVECDPIFD